MEHYTLNDLERLTGIRADTIRIWEQRYGTTISQRTATNRRWYSGEDLRKLINISILKRNGVRISDIAAMPLNELEGIAADLAKDNLSPDMLTDSLIIAMTKFDEPAVNEILLRSVISRGFQRTFSSLVFPFLHKVGVMWHTGSVGVGMEHFISNIFRRRLVVALDNQVSPVAPKSRKILMFLPENEYHELGLLYYAYIVRSLGHRVLYLGQSTPLNAVLQASENWDPEILITGALSAISFKDTGDFISELSHSFPGKKILFSGFLAGVAEEKGSKSILACRSEKELKMLIK